MTITLALTPLRPYKKGDGWLVLSMKEKVTMSRCLVIFMWGYNNDSKNHAYHYRHGD